MIPLETKQSGGKLLPDSDLRGPQEVGCRYMDRIGLAQDRHRWRTLVSAVMNLRVLWNAGNFLTSCKPVSFSRRVLHHGVSKSYQDARYERESYLVIMLWEMGAFRRDWWREICDEKPPRLYQNHKKRKIYTAKSEEGKKGHKHTIKWGKGKENYEKKDTLWKTKRGDRTVEEKPGGGESWQTALRLICRLLG